MKLPIGIVNKNGLVFRGKNKRLGGEIKTHLGAKVISSFFFKFDSILK